MSKFVEQEKVDKVGYDGFYSERMSPLADAGSAEAYRDRFLRERMVTLHLGGREKGYVRGLATRMLLDAADASGRPRGAQRVVDAGCGAGELSVYLASEGFEVVGVDLSESACAVASALAERVGVAKRCHFLAESLEQMSLEDASVDFIIGHGSLHHFIKYERVPDEFNRILTPAGQAYFADAFGENRVYHLFHDKQKMARLGDVILTRRLILEYFRDFKVTLIPTDWFVMLDKLYGRLFPAWAEPARRRISQLHFALDRRIPVRSRLALYLSGAVLTHLGRN